MLLSIGMMVKNEEKYLEQCLRSLMPILNNLDSELIIVDTGSTDNTVNIAKKYTKKIYYHKWNNNFSDMRNITLSHCHGEWLFIVDGDEIIENCDDIIDFFQTKLSKSYNSASIYVKNLTDLSDENKYTIFPSLRLFRNEKDFKYVNAVHNQPLYKEPIKVLSTNCKHYGYIINDRELMEKKYNRTVSILKNELEKDPYNIYYWHQLSVSYGMHSDYSQAVDSIEKAYELIKGKKEDVKKYIYVYHQLCLCYFNVKDYSKVEKYAKETLQYDKNLIDIYYFLGASLMLLKKDKEALNSFEEYLKLHKNYYAIEKNISVNDYTYGKINEVYYRLYVLNKEIKEYEKAKKYLLGITDEYEIGMDIVDLCIISKTYADLKKYEEDLILKNKLDEAKKLYIALENAKLEMGYEEEKVLTKLFCSGNTPYNFLNALRLKYEDEKTIDIKEINTFLEKIDLSSLEFYFGDLIYYMLLVKNDISIALALVSFEKINEYLEFFIKKHGDDGQCIYNYILEFGRKDDFYSAKVNKELCRYVILLDKLDKDKSKTIFKYYLQSGRKYLKLVYSDFVLENECWQAVRTEEEKFFIYINKAKNLEDIDKKAYIRYLREALKAYPIMKKGIEVLLNELKEDEKNKNNEFDMLKRELKENIKYLISQGKLKEAKSVITQYEVIEKNDIELYTMKSVIEVMNGDLEEAKKITHDGLRIDRHNADLLYNMSYLADKSNETEMAIEYYSKAKLFNPKSEVNVNGIITNLRTADSNKVLHGTMEIANQMNTLTTGLKTLGVDAKTLNYYPNYLGYKSDYVLNLNSFNNIDEANIETKELASKLIAQNDVFHFHFGTSLALDFSDLPILYELNKKVVMHHWGSDVRLLTKAVKLNKYAVVKNTDEYRIKKNLELQSRYIKHCIVADYELYQYVKDYYENVHIVSQAIDLNKYKVVEDRKENTDKMLIVHSPTNAEVKGTKHVLKAMEELKEKYDFEFKLIEGMPHEEAIAIYRKADLIIDQLMIGSYGLLSVEGMAMGKPVVCWISDFMKDKYPKELPLISANPNNIKEVVEHAIKNRDMLKKKGAESRKYVEKYHDMIEISKQIQDIYKFL